MKAWFYSLQEREQLFVVVAAVALAFALFWFGLWLPLDRGHESTAASVEVWKRSLAELKPLRGRLQLAGDNQQRAAAGNQSLVVIVATTSQNRGLSNSLQRSQPTTSNSIRVEFEDAAFDDLILWLGDLSTQYGLQVQSGSFSVGSSDAPGRVNSSLTLER